MPIFGPAPTPEHALALRDAYRMQGVGETNPFRRWVRTIRIDQLSRQLAEQGIPEHYTLRDVKPPFQFFIPRPEHLRPRFAPSFDVSPRSQALAEFIHAEGPELREAIRLSEEVSLKGPAAELKLRM